MWLSLLGPMLVRVDGEPLPLTAKQRVILAALGMRAGQVVSLGELCDALWGPQPPPSARVTARNHLKRLRQALGPSGGALIVTRDPGYLLRAASAEVDVLEFGRLCAAGGSAVRAADWQRAAGTLDEALALWRGVPLADVPSENLRREQVPRLEHTWLQAMEDRTGALLQLGRHGDLVPELHTLVATYPLREAFHGQLMLALYRCGHRAEALAAYRQARSVLAEELGIDPGPELRTLHQRVLADDPGLFAAPAPAALSGTPAPAGRVVAAAGGAASREPAQAASGEAATPPIVPRLLPAAVPYFAGRRAELASLSGLIGQPGGPAGAVMISAIVGTAGVGKTTLAVHWAHQVAHDFPDGQLYVNLLGFAPLANPLPPAEAVCGFLIALGVPPERIPPGPTAQAGMYRSLLARKRMLIVLDNARDEEHVRPLLPAGEGCLVLITSRTRLTGLAAIEGARLITLDVLDEPDASELLAHRLGGQQVTATPTAVADLARLCGRLPLALTIAAARAAAHPGDPVAALAADLRDERSRLDALAVGGAHSNVTAVFSWSYEQLGEAAARMFRLLGLHPGPDLTAEAAACLAGVPPEQAGEPLRELVRAHLFSEHTPGRHTCHDLLREYAARRCRQAEGDDGRRAALARLSGYYLAAATAAMDVFWPSESGQRPAPPEPVTPVTAPPTLEAARAWLDAERPNLVAMVTHLAREGQPGSAWRLALVISRYLDCCGHYPDAVTVHTSALEAAGLTGDLAAQAAILSYLSGSLFRRANYGQAIAQLQRAMALYAELGDRRGQARMLMNLGMVLRHQGRFDQASDYFKQALPLSRDLGDRLLEARVMVSLGITVCEQGQFSQAATHHREALTVYRERGDRDGEGAALTNLGRAVCRQGDLRQAVVHLRQALDIFREVGNPVGEGSALDDLGVAARKRGDYQQAADYHQQALGRYREADSRDGQAESLNGLGETLCSTGDHERAHAHHQAAYKLAAEIGDENQRARALDGLGCACRAGGDTDQARRHWQQALALYRDLGVYAAAEVSARLGQLSVSTHHG